MRYNWSKAYVVAGLVQDEAINAGYFNETVSNWAAE